MWATIAGPPQYQILESGLYEQSFCWTRGPRGLIAWRKAITCIGIIVWWILFVGVLRNMECNTLRQWKLQLLVNQCLCAFCHQKNEEEGKNTKWMIRFFFSGKHESKEQYHQCITSIWNSAGTVVRVLYHQCKEIEEVGKFLTPAWLISHKTQIGLWSLSTCN